MPPPQPPKGKKALATSPPDPPSRPFEALMAAPELTTWPRPLIFHREPGRTKLLEFDFRAGRFEFLLDVFGFGFRDAFLDRFAAGLDEVFGFFETQVKNRSYLFD